MSKCGADKSVLKISIIDTQTQRKLVLEGKLIQPWVDELRGAWKSAEKELDGRRLMIDLNNATVISSEGEDALFDLMKEGARFTCGGVLTRHVLRQLARRCHAKLESIDCSGFNGRKARRDGGEQ
jgi:hypothetical protein